jgi:uncharacterized protein
METRFCKRNEELNVASRKTISSDNFIERCLIFSNIKSIVPQRTSGFEMKNARRYRMGLIGNEKTIIGMIHLLPLPGSPKFRGSVDEIYDLAFSEAEILVRNNIDGLIVENFNDSPFIISKPSLVQVAFLAKILHKIESSFSIPIGINVLFNAWKAEISLAYACNCKFTRIEVFVDVVVSPYGIVQPCASKLRRYQNEIGAQEVQIWADIQTKTTENIIPKDIQQSAKEAEKAGASAIIVTGSATGQVTPLDKLEKVKKVASIPVIAASGVNVYNVKDTLKIADGIIVGTDFKEGGKASNRILEENVIRFMHAAKY